MRKIVGSDGEEERPTFCPCVLICKQQDTERKKRPQRHKKKNRHREKSRERQREAERDREI